MYKNLKEVKPDYRDPEVQQKELVDYLMQEFFGGNNRYSISKALYDKKITCTMYAAYRQCAELNSEDLKKTLAKKTGEFKNDYAKTTYIIAILKKHIHDEVKPAKQELPKQSFETSQRATDSQTSNIHIESKHKDVPAIAGIDSFESDSIHEAWLRMPEEEKRKNWEKGIAANKERKRNELNRLKPDEMY